MRVAIAGAGAVGRAVAATLLAEGHQVLLIERRREGFAPSRVPGADWMLADACELDLLKTAGIETCDVVVAATGDDKVNLVFSMLAKTEFAVPRAIARVNRPDNHWLFTELWGIDIAVSTPLAIVAAVEEAIIIGEVVQLVSLHQGRTSIVEITLPATSRLAGRRLAELALPEGAAVVAVIRAGSVTKPGPEFTLQPHDELLLLTAADVREAVQDALRDRLS